MKMLLFDSRELLINGEISLILTFSQREKGLGFSVLVLISENEAKNTF